MFDLNSLAIQDTTVMNVKSPKTGEPITVNNDGVTFVTITMASTGSRAYRQAVSAMQNRQLKRGKKQPTAEDQRKEGIDLLVACCITSENLGYNGVPVKTESDFRAILSDDKFHWLKTQVDECLGDVENFIN